MSVLLLGHTGFVGRNLAESFEQSGLEWIGVSRSAGVDLRDGSQLLRVLQDHRPRFIVNCAAHVGSLNYVTTMSAEVVRDNTLMALALYDAVAKSVPGARVINPIANCAYPATEDTLVEDEWMSGPLHRSVLSYGATRRMLYWTGESYLMQYGVRSVYFLVPNMYGPYDSTDPNKAHALNALAAKFVKARNANAPEVEVWGTGVAIREWLYAPDFARVIEAFVREPEMLGLSEPLNVGQNLGVSVRELVELIRAASGFSGSVRFDHSKPDGAPKKVMDDTRFKKVFPGFEFTHIQRGLEKCIAHYGSRFPF